MHGIAHLLSGDHPLPHQLAKVWHSFYKSKRTRERFSREQKPLDHLGGLSPEGHAPMAADRHDLDILPKEGTSLENVDVFIG